MSVTSSSYSKKQQAHPQKPAILQAQQQQHSPGSNEMKLTAQQSTDDKSLFDNDASNNENETKLKFNKRKKFEKIFLQHN